MKASAFTSRAPPHPYDDREGQEDAAASRRRRSARWGSGRARSPASRRPRRGSGRRRRAARAGCCPRCRRAGRSCSSAARRTASPAGRRRAAGRPRPPISRPRSSGRQAAFARSRRTSRVGEGEEQHAHRRQQQRLLAEEDLIRRHQAQQHAVTGDVAPLAQPQRPVDDQRDHEQDDEVRVRVGVLDHRRREGGEGRAGEGRPRLPSRPAARSASTRPRPSPRGPA